MNLTISRSVGHVLVFSNCSKTWKLEVLTVSLLIQTRVNSGHVFSLRLDRCPPPLCKELRVVPALWHSLAYFFVVLAPVSRYSCVIPYTYVAWPTGLAI